LAFNGSGHILHSIFWTVMAPLGRGGKPGIHTTNQINSYFGSFNAFAEQFKSAAENVEASGWGILTWQPTWRRLEILQAEKHQDLTQWSGIPIFGMRCLWEHAYYLDYQNRRKEYISRWWDLINWHEVERRLLLAMNGQVPLTVMIIIGWLKFSKSRKKLSSGFLFVFFKKAKQLQKVSISLAFIVTKFT